MSGAGLLLSVSGLTKRYGRFRALDDVSFQVNRAQILGVIGPNGAGKTTLLECLAGRLSTDAGTVTEAGRNPSASATSQTVFYLPDAIAPWPSQTVRWALDFVVGFLNGRLDAMRDTIRDLSLDPFLDQRIGTLSKGQRKRAMLAIGLLAPQPVLVCDEPFDGLDLRQTREVAAMLRRLASQGRTFVLSIHQIADAATVCDRFVLISAGRVCGEGTLAELAARAGMPGTPIDLPEVFLALT
ncbi:MAG TPA: ABC transporter ATP-binding protein [Vicinamibacterales bacterium]|nr:ABC transporter ATP-binding protein [Vicinamibacterales bacterium]